MTLTDSAPYLANGASTACADRPSSGGYAFFDADSGTLTLYNADILDSGWPFRTDYGIYSSGDLNIVLEGSNTVKGDGVAGGYDSYGIYCNGDVTISGEIAAIEGGSVAGTVPISCGIYCEGTVIPKKDSESDAPIDSPKIGDTTPPVLWGLMAAACIVLCTAVMCGQKKVR